MPTRPCLGTPGRACGRLTTRSDSRCPACASAMGKARDARRGSRQDRGYGPEHEARRAALLAALVPGSPCPRCGLPMWHTQELHAGHPPDAPLRLDRTSLPTRIEHSHCNEGARD